MLIIVLGLCVIMSVFVAIRRRDALSLCFLGMTLSLVLMLSGVTVYIAKMGGVAAAERAFLYLIPGLP